MTKIVSVKFKEGGKSYLFAPGEHTYQKGMGVIVETSKGLEYATVVLPDGEVDESLIVAPLKPIVRIATEKDEEQVRRNRERKGEAIQIAQQKIEERGLEMKLVDCEFAFDGSKVTFYFTAESRVDFRELIKDLSAAFHSRIDLRQITIREEIKMTGGLGMCGRECCCINCMKEPLKVSVKMAKNQGLSLNPSKISGLCGRLMCCLSYENDYYSEACKQVPKVGSEIDTPDGRGMVVNVNMLKMTVKVKIEQNDSVSYHDFTVEEIRTGKRAPKEEEEKVSVAERILSDMESEPNSPEAHEGGEGAPKEGHGKRHGKNRDRGRGRQRDEGRGENAEKKPTGGEPRQGDSGERKQNKNGKRKHKGNNPARESGGQIAPAAQGGKQEGQGNKNKSKKQNGQNRQGDNNGQHRQNDKKAQGGAQHNQGNAQHNQGGANGQGNVNGQGGGQKSGKHKKHRHGKGGGENKGQPSADNSQK